MLIGFAYDVLQADWFCLLSGEDRPVIDLARWERDLPRAAFDALLPGGPLVRHAPFGRRPSFSEQSYVRYEYRWRRVPFPNLRHRAVHGVFLPFGGLSSYCQPLFAIEYFWNRNAWFLGTPRRRTERPANWILFRGESWISFNRKAAAVILNATPSVSGHFCNTMIVVESYFHTLLRNDPDLVIKHGKFMYV